MIFPITPRAASLCLLLAALIAGTISDRPRERAPLFVGGYRVLSADFHVHSFPLSWATLGPWNTVLEARRQDLDVIAMTPHNHVWVAKLGHWFSLAMGGAPSVLVAEEIVSPRYHLLAVGIRDTIAWRQKSERAIDAIHSQGGVAIAAHPVASFWPGFDAEAMSKLDGAEVLHPLVYEDDRGQRELQQFYARAPLAAIGDSDYHGLRPMGLCRTFVFAREDSESAVLEALRAHRTVVYGSDGRAFGDLELIRLAAQEPRFTELRSLPLEGQGALPRLSRICGLLGLFGFAFFGFRSSRPSGPYGRRG